MHISQWDGRNVVLLDQLDKPTNMGREVFSSGYISFDTMRSLSAALDGFCAVAREYGVTRVHASATTALREAANRAYILDHLATKNNMDVQVLDDIEANALIFNSMNMNCSISGKEAKNIMMIYGGTGITAFSLLRHGQTAFAYTIPTGLLKMSEMLLEAADYSMNTGFAAEEYLLSFLYNTGRMDDMLTAEGIVFGAADMQPLFELCRVHGELEDNNMAMIRSNVLIDIYESYSRLSVDQISAKHKLSASRGGVLYAALSLLALLVKMTNVEKVYCTQVNMVDVTLDLILRPKARQTYEKSLRAGVIASALDIAARYGCDTKHSLYISKLALTLFKELSDLHGHSQRQSMLLYTACILHDVGSHTYTINATEASYALVKDAQIHGLKSHETLLAANIISPQSLLGITTSAWREAALKEDELLFVGKMHAILHLSNALDYSRRQKAELVGVRHDENSLVIHLKIREDYTLEQWVLRQSASIFQDVFGIALQLRIENHSMGGGPV